jgi:hypothetical protein
MQSVTEATEVKGQEERCNESVHMPSQSNVGERLVKLQAHVLTLQMLAIVDGAYACGHGSVLQSYPCFLTL